MPLASGVRLGPYEIVAPLGSGGMGEVYKARDTRLDRTVAIKVLAARIAADPQFRERFEREARVVAALNHPHICVLHDIGQQDGIDYLVMEYLEGQTLAERLENGALPLDHALQYAIQIADALDKAHRQGITHRDLKPGNIFLCSRGPTPARARHTAFAGDAGRRRYAAEAENVKLLDFGLAKLSGPVAAGAGLSMLPTTPPNLTAQGTILGTFQYMAPEQLEGKEADPRTDIFAFGAVLYEMITGKKAFEGKSHASLIAAILEHEPPAISTLQPLTPRVLDRVVKICLAKDPDERWQSARDLLHELKGVAEAGARPLEMPPAGAPRRRRERLAWSMTAASLIVAGSAVAATLYFRPPMPEPVVTRLDVVTPPTTEAFSFALSPDGRQLVFVANGEKGSQLWVRSLDQVTARPLAGTEGAIYPFWAPDSHAVGFFAEGKLKRLDLAGGVPQVLADAPLGRGGTWNSDGVIVFAPTTTSPLMRVMATGGTPVAVTRFGSGQGSHRWPQFLPDGRRMIFLVTLGQPQTHGVYVAAVDGGEPTRVLAGETAAVYALPGYLLFVSQGVLVAQRFDATRATVEGEPIPVTQALGIDDGTFRSAFSVSATGTLAHRAGMAARRQLVWVDRTGKVLNALGAPDENVLAHPALAPDGQRVAVSRIVQGNFDVWLMDVSRGVASRFTFDAALDSFPIWSPDGSRVVFASARKGAWNLFEKPASGGADEQPLLLNMQDKTPLDWSRDGPFVLFEIPNDPRTASDLWALPLMGERKPFPVVQTGFDEVGGQFSPDGRWLAYASNESGRYEIYIRPFPEPGGKWQVSTAGGTQPRWRRDGQELFYVAPDARLMATPIRFATAARTVETRAPVALFATRLASGANIGSIGSTAVAQYAVAADGRFLMNVAADEAVTSPITIVLNWQSALGARERR